MRTNEDILRLLVSKSRSDEGVQMLVKLSEELSCTTIYDLNCKNCPLSFYSSGLPHLLCCARSSLMMSTRQLAALILEWHRFDSMLLGAPDQ